MAIFEAARIARAPAAGLAAVGVFWGGFAAYVPEIKLRSGASDGELGLALIMAAAGGIVAMALVPRYLAALGRHALPLAMVVVALALFYPLGARGVPGLALALFGMGASVSLLDIGTNVRLSMLEDRHQTGLMNLAHAMFSFALGLSALAASLARSAGWPPDVVFPILSAVVLALGLITREPAAPHHAAPPRPAGAPADGAWPVILPVAAVLFLCFVAENSIEAWSALHVERTLGAPAGQGGFGPTMLGLTMGVARLGGHYAVTRLGETGLILWSVALGTLGAAVLAAAPTPIVGMAGIALMGFGVAVVVPTANSILGRLVRPDQRGQAISRAWMIGFTGFFLGPVMMGQISEVVGLRAAFAVIAALVALIAPFVLILRARGG